jgi:hypothetical protein
MEQYLYENIDSKYVLTDKIENLVNFKSLYRVIEITEYNMLEKDIKVKNEEIERLNKKLKNRDEIINRYFKKIKSPDNNIEKNSIVKQLSGCTVLKNITLEICSRSIYQTERYIVETKLPNNTDISTIKRYIKSSTIEEIYPQIIYLGSPKAFKVTKAFINSKGTWHVEIANGF